jgi:iron-sulfur cluster repair protein YtfE (RIC family)
MTGGRIDFYTKVHKALRARLFQLSQRAAASDYADPQVLAVLSRDLEAALAQLSSHARHEARFIHPLLKEKAADNPFDAEHDALEADQAQLERRLASVLGAPQAERPALGLTFYRALNVFIARYLEHLAREEESMTVLWERCTDAELAAVMTAFGASRPLGEALADMGWMLPTLSPQEQAELLSAMARSLQPGTSAGPR